MSSISDSPAQVAVVLSGWPRVSEVFALNEVLALRRAGMLAAVFATKRQPDGIRQPGASELDPLITFLPEGDARPSRPRRRARLRDLPVSRPCTATSPTSPRPSQPQAAERLGVPYGFSVACARRPQGRRRPTSNSRARGAAVVICCNADVAADIAGHGPATDTGAPRRRPHPVPGGPRAAR